MLAARVVSVVLVAIAWCVASAPAYAVSDQFFGLHLDPAQADNNVDLGVVQRSGVKVVRVQIKWRDVQPSPGAPFNWGKYDSIVSRSAQRGITILPYLYGGRETDAPFPDEGTTQYADWPGFVKAVTRRYGYTQTPGDPSSFWVAHPEVPYMPMRVWEVWNEPNSAMNNPGGVAVQPAKYARFLIYTANAIRASQPFADTKVLIGGLYAFDSSNGQQKTVQDYLQSTYTVPGFDNAYDGLSLHPYALAGDRLKKVQDKVTAAHNTLGSLSPGGGKTLWITELGWPVTPAEFGVSPSTQASLLTSSFDWIKARADAWNIKYLAWYFYRDLPVSGWAYHTGLRDEAGNFRPAWTNFLAQTGAGWFPYTNAPRLYSIALNGTSSGSLEVHTLNPATGYTNFLDHLTTPLTTTVENRVQHVAGDINRDGLAELVEVQTSGTWSGKTEVHPLNGATGFTSFIGQTATAAGLNTADQVQYVMGDITRDGIPEIVDVDLDGTGSGKTEVHPLNGATGYKTFIGQAATALHPVTRDTFQFAMADYNRDGYQNLYAIAMQGGSGKTEVHVLSGATNFSTFLAHDVTALGQVTRDQWQFEVGDYNSDGYPDLYAIALQGWSGQTEVHILNGATSFSTFMEQINTALHTTTTSGWQFALRGP